MESIDKKNKVIVPFTYYSSDTDKRVLIPFIRNGKIGFADREGNIVINPVYDFYIDEFLFESSLIRVGLYSYAVFERKTGDPKVYTRKIFGLINSKGELIIPVEYEGISAPIFSSRYTVRSQSKGYAVMDCNGNIIVPFGKYGYIDGFDSGVARIKIGNSSNGLRNADCKWGIIDEAGNEVLPPIYSNIWNFYDKCRQFTRVEKDEETYEFHLFDQELRPAGYAHQKELEFEREMENYHACREYHENQTYEQFNGTYAQDVAGLSDQTINDAFDGDPDAYWNID